MPERIEALSPESLSSGRVRRARFAGLLIGLMLIGAAAVAVATRSDALTDAWDALRHAPVNLLTMALLLPLASVALTSVTFWILTTRYGRVGPGEMFALIGSAWLLNYLPFWPGMIGRLTYHKMVNAIAVRDAAKAILWANVLSVLAAGVLVTLVAIGAVWFAGDDLLFGVIVASPIALLALAAIYALKARPEADPEVWRILAALAVRIVELHIHAARTFVCFSLVGVPIGWGGALAISGAAGLAGAVNIAPNGLGVREWVVGLVAPALPSGLVLRTDLKLAQGLSADLVNRAAEVLVAIPVGLLSAAWLARRVRKLHAAQPASQE